MKIVEYNERSDFRHLFLLNKVISPDESLEQFKRDIDNLRDGKVFV